MWENKTLYWAWRSLAPAPKPPTVKRIEYAKITYQGITHQLAVGVWDDGKYTPINRDEVEWNAKHGAVVKMPNFPDSIHP